MPHLKCIGLYVTNLIPCFIITKKLENVIQYMFKYGLFNTGLTFT